MPRRQKYFYRIVISGSVLVAAYGFVIGKDGWKDFLVAAFVATQCAGDLKMEKLAQFVQMWRTRE